MATWSRIARYGLQAAKSSLQQQSSQEGQAVANALKQYSMQSRSFASGGHGHHDSVTHAGLTLHKPAKWHKITGEALAGLMWFWIFYRFYHDYDTFIYGHAQHHEHVIHEEEHGDGKHH